MAFNLPCKIGTTAQTHKQTLSTLFCHYYYFSVNTSKENSILKKNQQG